MSKSSDPGELASESRDRQPAARLAVHRAGAGLQDGVRTLRHSCLLTGSNLQPRLPPAHSDHTTSFSHLGDLILGAPAMFSASSGSQVCNGVTLVFHVLPISSATPPLCSCYCASTASELSHSGPLFPSGSSVASLPAWLLRLPLV